MKTLFTFFVFLVLSVSVYAQNNNFENENDKRKAMDADYHPEDSDKIRIICSEMPKFPGDLMKYLSDSIQYPDTAKDIDIVGVIYITFVIEKDGSVTNVKTLRGIQGDRGLLENEAEKIIREMPKWKPGKENGHPVRIQYTVPIHIHWR